MLLWTIFLSDGIGSSSSKTEGISSEEEDMLWKSGVINLKTPKGLLRAAFFVCGKCFCLRGGSEHRNLTLSHFQRLYKPDRYVYRERASKNKQGGLRHLRMEHKVVSIVSDQSAGDRCPLFILDLYISKLPEKAKQMDLFYCRPLSALPKDTNDPWFSPVAIGKNTLANMVKDMCEEAEINGPTTV